MLKNCSKENCTKENTVKRNTVSLVNFNSTLIKKKKSFLQYLYERENTFFN